MRRSGYLAFPGDKLSSSNEAYSCKLSMHSMCWPNLQIGHLICWTVVTKTAFLRVSERRNLPGGTEASPKYPATTVCLGLCPHCFVHFEGALKNPIAQDAFSITSHTHTHTIKRAETVFYVICESHIKIPSPSSIRRAVS